MRRSSDASALKHLRRTRPDENEFNHSKDEKKSSRKPSKKRSELRRLVVQLKLCVLPTIYLCMNII